MFSNITFIHGFILSVKITMQCCLELVVITFRSIVSFLSPAAFNLKSVIFCEKVVFQNKLKIYLVVALDWVLGSVLPM